LETATIKPAREMGGLRHARLVVSHPPIGGHAARPA
jgi:hypothetical protein